MFGPSFDRTRLDTLTLGLDRKAARGLHKVPRAIARLSATRRITQRLAGTYDAVLMPTQERGNAAHRPSRPDGRLRPGHGPTIGMGGVHATAERHR